MSVEALPKVGSRIWVGGGYDVDPEWLSGKVGIEGTVMAFVPGQNEEPALVVKLDAPLSFRGTSGQIVVLELRYAGAKWDKSGTVHVELCAFIPEAAPWKDRRQGVWVESHAGFRLAA